MITKSMGGLPEPLRPRGVDLRAEAAKARRRLMPTTVAYTGSSLLLLWLAVRSGRSLGVIAAFLAAGSAAWTLLEYLFHRYVLHGPFPDGPGWWRHLKHRKLDHLHVAHHERPWDGNHINGTISDTLPVVTVLSGVAVFTPLHTFPMFVVGLVLSYVAEEWIHHSVHFYNFDSRYFRYIRRHHLYHHSRHGTRVAYGLTSGMWDVVWRTRADRPLDDPVGAPRAAERAPGRRTGNEGRLRRRMFAGCRERQAPRRPEETTH